MPLKVLFCTDNFGVGGSELNAIRTAERLASHGVTVEVAALQAHGPLRARYDEAGIRVHVLPLRNLYGPGSWQQGLRLGELVRRGRFDVVHCHDIYTNIFASFWVRLRSAVPLVLSRRWGADSTQGRLEHLNRWAQRGATAVLANSAAVAGLVRQEGTAERRVVVIPNFLEDRAFAPPSDVAAWRQGVGIPPAAKVIGVVARLSPVKDLGTLLAAMPAVASQVQEAHLAIVGDGPERPRLERLAAELGISGRVTFTGALPSRPNLHGLFDLSALTSTSEGFPNTLAEAMAAGNAVVATAVGGVPDVVLDGRTGLLVPPGDPATLAAALADLLQDDARRRALGDAGRASARERFSEEHVLTQLVSLYRKLAR